MLSIVAVEVLATWTAVVFPEITFGLRSADGRAGRHAVDEDADPVGRAPAGVMPMRLPRIVADAESAFSDTPSMMLPAMMLRSPG